MRSPLLDRPMITGPLLLALLWVTAFAPGVGLAQDGIVRLSQENHTLTIKIGEELFTQFNFEPDQRKPFFYPVNAPGEILCVRTIEPDEKDHPHHKGIWASVDEVNHCRHWMERERIISRDLRILVPQGDPAIFEAEADWFDADNHSLLQQVTTIRVFSDRLITFDIKLASWVPTVTFGDTKEGFFGVRVAESMKEKSGGHVINADGKTGTTACWGRPSPWVDYTGKVGDETVGITLFDHPANFRPSRYHVRDYGLFTISPFGEGAYQTDPALAKPVTLTDQDAPLRLQYAIYVHTGDAAGADIPAAYEKFLTAVDKQP